jgi:hypothetical protein
MNLPSPAFILTFCLTQKTETTDSCWLIRSVQHDLS